MKRISKISVRDLFGAFDHDLPLRLDDGLTIIHGPNGVGKTAVLRLIDGLFNRKYWVLREIPFTKLRVDFDDDSSVTVFRTVVEPENDPKHVLHSRIDLVFVNSEGRTEKGRYSPSSIPHVAGLPPEYLTRSVPDLHWDGSHYIYLPTGEQLSEAEAWERAEPWSRFQVDISSLVNASINKKDLVGEVPDWLTSLDGKIHFIQTQRLLTRPRVSRARTSFDRDEPTSVVQKNAMHLARAIQRKLSEYAAISQRLDRTFPSRVITEGSETQIPIEQLRAKLRELEQRRQSLTAAGLLEREESSAIEVPRENVDRTFASMLAVYVRDSEEKLSVFDEIALKIDALKEIINSRFLYKEMTVDSEQGFGFRSTNGNSLKLTSLSSGEQHELILFYDLLFRVDAHSLILIDEPEISLHVAWQEQFLKDLEKVIGLNRFDVLIATHSPHIIFDRWDLTVELSGPNQ